MRQRQAPCSSNVSELMGTVTVATSHWPGNQQAGCPSHRITKGWELSAQTQRPHAHRRPGWAGKEAPPPCCGSHTEVQLLHSVFLPLKYDSSSHDDRTLWHRTHCSHGSHPLPFFFQNQNKTAKRAFWKQPLFSRPPKAGTGLWREWQDVFLHFTSTCCRWKWGEWISKITANYDLASLTSVCLWVTHAPAPLCIWAMKTMLHTARSYTSTDFPHNLNFSYPMIWLCTQ